MFKQLIILTHVSKYQIFHILDAFQMNNNFVGLILFTATKLHVSIVLKVISHYLQKQEI